MSFGTTFRLSFGIALLEYANEIFPLLRRITVATAMEFRIFSEAVGAPAFMNIRRAGEVLEDGFQVMARFGVAAQSVIGVEFSEERATAALFPVFFVLFPHRWLIGPAGTVKLF